MQKARQVIQTKQSEVIGTVSITPMGEWNADLNYTPTVRAESYADVSWN